MKKYRKTVINRMYKSQEGRLIGLEHYYYEKKLEKAGKIEAMPMCEAAKLYGFSSCTSFQNEFKKFSRRKEVKAKAASKEFETYGWGPRPSKK